MIADTTAPKLDLLRILKNAIPKLAVGGTRGQFIRKRLQCETPIGGVPTSSAPLRYRDLGAANDDRPGGLVTGGCYGGLWPLGTVALVLFAPISAVRRMMSLATTQWGASRRA